MRPIRARGDFLLRAHRNALRLATVLVVAGLALWQFFTEAPLDVVHEPGATVRVQRAVDGDTLLLEDRSRVRLLGVDTPETKKPDWPVERFGPEAHEFTSGHVAGRHVRLEFDKERHDKYGRVLAYVYLDDWFLNEELIRAGLGKAETKYPYSETMKRRFRAAQREAQHERRGIWSIERETGKTKFSLSDCSTLFKRPKSARRSRVEAISELGFRISDYEAESCNPKSEINVARHCTRLRLAAKRCRPSLVRIAAHGWM